jgi:hypothetical protein
MHNFNIFNGPEKPNAVSEKPKLGNISANLSTSNEKGLFSYSSKNAVKLNQGIDFAGVPGVHLGPTSTKHSDRTPNIGTLNSNNIMINKQKNQLREKYGMDSGANKKSALEELMHESKGSQNNSREQGQAYGNHKKMNFKDKIASKKGKAVGGQGLDIITNVSYGNCNFFLS